MFLMYRLPLVECLMFGALISATDPVTVLSIFQVLDACLFQHPFLLCLCLIIYFVLPLFGLPLWQFRTNSRLTLAYYIVASNMLILQEHYFCIFSY